MLWKPRESWEEHSPLCVVLRPTDPACVYSSIPLSVWKVPGVLHRAAGVAFCWYFEGRREVGSFPDGVPTTGKGWHTAALWKSADNPGVGGMSGGTPTHVALEPSVKPGVDAPQNHGGVRGWQRVRRWARVGDSSALGLERGAVACGSRGVQEKGSQTGTHTDSQGWCESSAHAVETSGLRCILSHGQSRRGH